MYVCGLTGARHEEIHKTQYWSHCQTTSSYMETLTTLNELRILQGHQRTICAVQKLGWLNRSLCNHWGGIRNPQNFKWNWWAWWHRVRLRMCNIKTLFVWECGGETTWCKEKNHTDILLRWRVPGDILFPFPFFLFLLPAPSCEGSVIETPGGPAVFLLLCDTIADTWLSICGITGAPQRCGTR